MAWHRAGHKSLHEEMMAQLSDACMLHQAAPGRMFDIDKVLIINTHTHQQYIPQCMYIMALVALLVACNMFNRVRYFIGTGVIVHCPCARKVMPILLGNGSVTTQITKFMRPTWDPPGSCRPQMGPMLAPWTLLSGESQKPRTVCIIHGRYSEPLYTKR